MDLQVNLQAKQRIEEDKSQFNSQSIGDSQGNWQSDPD
jgi:hypothetical protein